MPYGHAEWEFELFKEARDFIRMGAIEQKDESIKEHAKKMCEKFTYLIGDLNWDFATGKST
jgi:hypothetical protein